MSFPSSIKNALLGVSIADADAAVGDVKDPKTFYSVTPPKKTGTMPTVAIAAGSSAYLAGYHAGNAGGLEAVDADLVAGNIKSGVVIFGKTGPATVQDISGADAAVGEVKSPKTFFSVSGAVKTGTMPTQSLSPASENVPAGYYAATTLSAIDTDLAPANIKSGVTIFGHAGSFAPTPSYELHSYGDLAAEAYYTIAASGLFQLASSALAWVRMEVTWIAGSAELYHDYANPLLPCEGTGDERVRNQSTTTGYAYILMRSILKHTNPQYESRYATGTIGAGVSVTLTEDGFYMADLVGGAGGSVGITYLGIDFFDGTNWRAVKAASALCPFFIGKANYARYKNTSGSTAYYKGVGRWW